MNCRNCGAPLTRRITCEYCGSYNTAPSLSDIYDIDLKALGFGRLGDVYDVDPKVFQEEVKSLLPFIPFIGPLLFMLYR